MNLEQLFLNGYGVYVWPAFIFTLASCFLLFLKTKNDLKEAEEIFNKNFTTYRATEVEIKERKNKEKEVFSNVSII